MRTLQKINRLLKTLFTIGEDREDSDVLLLQTGVDHCSCGYFNEASRSFNLIRYIGFDDGASMETKLPAILREIKGNRFKKVLVCSAFEQALIIPQKTSADGSRLLNSMYDGPFSNHRSDVIGEWQVINAYAMPDLVHGAFESAFPMAKYIHAYTPVLKVYNGFMADDQVDIDFSVQHFRVMVKKSNQLQLIQTYAYKTPLDVIYYLLKICYEYGLNQSEVFVILSGLVDSDSAMYKELHHYFLHLHFAKTPDYKLPASDHPHHYFTSLYNLAACVS